MKIPDLSIIEKTLNNEATSEESCEVVRWFKTPEGQAWLAERIDQDEKTIHMGGRGMDRPSDTLSRNVSEYYAATPPTKNTPFYSVCGCGLYTDRFNYRTFHTHKLTSGFVGGWWV